MARVGLFTRLLYRIVRNDAMKEDPPEIYGWRVFLLACSACFGGMLFGLDIGIIGGVLTLEPFMRTYGTWELKQNNPKAAANLNQNIVSTFQAGAFAGCFFAFWVSDHRGRKFGLLACAVIANIGIIMQTAGSGELAVMYIGRFIAGVGVGAASTIVPIYIAENAPRAIRGGLTGIYQLFIASGTMLAFWINYGSALHIKGNAVYLVPLAMQALPSVALLFLIPFNNESPRFLAKQDRWEDAAAALSRVRNLPSTHEYIRGELTEMAAQLEHERELIGGASTKDLLKEMFTIPGNRKRTLISIGLMVCQQMTGTNAINYYAPQIFESLGIVGSLNGLFATGIYGVVKVTMCACFLLFAADSLGRRRSLLWTSIAQGCAMYYMGLYVRISPPIKGQPVPAQGYVALVCVYLFAGFFQFGWGPVCWIYVSEIPAARLRSLNVAMAAATQWLFQFVVTRATLTMTVTAGRAGYGTFLIYGSFCFAMFFFVWFLIPETKGLSLEAMDTLFGVTDVKKHDPELDSPARAGSTEHKGPVDEVRVVGDDKYGLR